MNVQPLLLAVATAAAMAAAGIEADTHKCYRTDGRNAPIISGCTDDYTSGDHYCMVFQSGNRDGRRIYWCGDENSVKNIAQQEYDLEHWTNLGGPGSEICFGMKGEYLPPRLDEYLAMLAEGKGTRQYEGFCVCKNALPDAPCNEPNNRKRPSGILNNLNPMVPFSHPKGMIPLPGPAGGPAPPPSSGHHPAAAPNGRVGTHKCYVGTNKSPVVTDCNDQTSVSGHHCWVFEGEAHRATIVQYGCASEEGMYQLDSALDSWLRGGKPGSEKCFGMKGRKMPPELHKKLARKTAKNSVKTGGFCVCKNEKADEPCNKAAVAKTPLNSTKELMAILFLHAAIYCYQQLPR